MREGWEGGLRAREVLTLTCGIYLEDVSINIHDKQIKKQLKLI